MTAVAPDAAAAAAGLYPGAPAVDDDSFPYEEVEVDGPPGHASGGDESLASPGGAGGDATLDDPKAFETLSRAVHAAKERDAPPPVRADLTRLPVVVDDFVRNFLAKHQMHTTLSTFESEWYERHGGVPMEEPEAVSDLYLENARLVDRATELEREVAKHRAAADKALALWERVKKERDMHRITHNRVLQEKGRLTGDLKRLQEHSTSIEPTVVELRQKYEASQKDKMMLRLERDKLASRVQKLEETVKELEAAAGGRAADGAGSSGDASGVAASGGAGATKKKGTTATKKGASAVAAAAAEAALWPADSRPNPYHTQAIKAPSNAQQMSCRNTIRAHAMAATGVAIHPKKAVAATCSDDGSWRLLALPSGEVIMSGEGHEDWVAGIAMHPKGTMAATASGDKTVKLWDFASAKCVQTFRCHTDSVWCVDFQDTGELLASGSVDHSARIIDITKGKVRQTLRGHVDAVNTVAWIPFTNTLATGSGDKTVSLWDARSNFCAQTFYGHQNAVAKVAVSLKADQLASCDADGTVITWDIRMVTQRQSFAFGPTGVNCVAFDKSGSYLAAGCDDGTIRVASLVDGKVGVLKGHDDAVQALAYDPVASGFLVSAGSDCTVRYWS